MVQIKNIHDRQQQKEATFERNVLQELRLETVEQESDTFLQPFLSESLRRHPGITEMAIDIGIDAFLLGARFSKFGYHGEKITDVKKRCAAQEKELMDMLFTYYETLLSYTSAIDSLYLACDLYIDRWWQEGYTVGKRRYLLRMI